MQRIALILTSIFCCSASFADQEGGYFGADLAKTNFAMKERFGENFFGKNPVASNFFIGYNLTDNVFLEAGYQSHKTKRLEATIDGSDYSPGTKQTIFDLVGANNIDVKSKLNIEQFYLGFGVKYNFLTLPKLSLLGFAGAAPTQMRANYIVLKADGFIIANPAFRHFTRNSLFQIFKVGLKYNLTNNFSIRLLSSWTKMADFKIAETYGADDGAGNIFTIGTKNNAFTNSIGIVYAF